MAVRRNDGASPNSAAAVLRIEPHRLSVDELRAMLAGNPTRAARWIERAAKAGCVSAQIVWGQLLLEGYGIVKRDPEAAFRAFEGASASGDPEALNMAGRCYEQGWGVGIDLRRAIALFEAAARANHTWAQVNLAQMLMRRGDPADHPRCFVLFKAAAEGGTLKANVKAMNSLARFLEEGWAAPPDPAAALFWYERAARLGDHWAQFNLATILFRRGLSQAANRWLQNAIVVSDNGFRRRIAPLLLARPEPSLRQHGVDALARCAADGAPADLYSYACAIGDGAADLPDPERAAVYFRLAAAKGHPQALARVARIKRTRWWKKPFIFAAGRERAVH